MPHGEAFDREAAEDLTALPEDELRARLERAWRDLRALTEEGRPVSYRRTLLRGRMDVIVDVIRAELVRRGAVARSPEPEKLARSVLLGGPVVGGPAEGGCP